VESVAAITEDGLGESATVAAAGLLGAFDRVAAVTADFLDAGRGVALAVLAELGAVAAIAADALIELQVVASESGRSADQSESSGGDEGSEFHGCYS